MSAAPAAIVFDWDGTLVDNWSVIHESLNDTLAAWGLPTWTREEAMDRISRSQRDSFPVLFGERWQEARDRFYAGFEARHREALIVLEGAGAVLERCAALDLWIAVVSNKRGDYLRREVAYLGWEDRFAAVVGAQDASEDKPSAAPILLAMETAPTMPGPDVWLVGDSPTDMRTARNAGLTAVLVRQAGANPAPMSGDLVPDHEVAGLRHLEALLARAALPP